MPTLICNCNRTMPLDADRLGTALDEPLTLHSSLCRREAPAFQDAIRQGDEVIVACTQERALFSALADATPEAVSPIRFVNIRETGGWSKDATQATPKMAALLAAARLPDAEPVAAVTYRSEGRLLIIGAGAAVQRAAAWLGSALDVTVFATGPTPEEASERVYPVLRGQLHGLTGWLGAFDLEWSANNPIDLDLCTRCNACIKVCPEGAIGLDYQVDLDRCGAHRACVAACEQVGAIDFAREAAVRTERFDLVLDLTDTPFFTQHAPPQGYFRWDGEDPGMLLRVQELVGEFEKPKFFAYRQPACAHSRNTDIGCNACVEICSALAISSDPKRQQIVVNPNLCVGCGACTTVCPTGAISYSYPRAPEQGERLRTMLATYARAGGEGAVLLLHSEEAGARLIETLGREASLGRAHGVPANVIPVALWHTASTGLDIWLSALAYGACRVMVLTTGEEAPQYLDGLRAQMAIGQSLLNGLGYAGTHLDLLQATDAAMLDTLLGQMAQTPRPQTPPVAARYAIAAEKRTTLTFALDHFIEHAGQLPDSLSLPEGAPGVGAPFGTVEVNKDTCTLCMSCVSACPASALQDNPDTPQLRFLERNCVQCGLCAGACPEDAIELVPRLLLTPERRTLRVINETQPFHCIRCHTPFGTLKAIEAMIGRLSGHSMFQGAALERLKMCGDCRVVDLYSGENEVRITDL